jgi:hypothetical protein
MVEAYLKRGKTRHRTVLNLGRKDLLAAHLDLGRLMRLLHDEAAHPLKWGGANTVRGV